MNTSTKALFDRVNTYRQKYGEKLDKAPLDTNDLPDLLELIEELEKAVLSIETKLSKYENCQSL